MVGEAIAWFGDRARTDGVTVMCPAKAARPQAMADAPSRGGFPISAVILFGLGLGGFLDGIVLHQVLQWHHSSSRGSPG
jgi:Predicted membrane protein (DUF2243)